MWKHVKAVRTSLVLMCVAHALFSLLSEHLVVADDCYVKSSPVGISSIKDHWDPEHHVCGVTIATGQPELLAFYIFSKSYSVSLQEESSLIRY